MKERELREHLTETGRNPFREWLHALRDPQARARIRVRLNRIRLGNLGDCKPVGERTQTRDIATAKQYWQSYQRRTS